MSILHPENMTLFFTIPIIIFFLIQAHRARLARYKKLSPEFSPPNNLFGRVTITSIFLGLIITALLGPYSGVTEIKKGAVGSDNLVVLDISDSMRADDVKPSRLEAAKRKILDLSQMLRQRNPGDRIGVILFAGTAYMYCPPTVDYNALKQFVGYIRPELITAQGSAINEALRITAEVIDRLKIKTPRLFLMTDGEDAGLAEAAATKALNNMGLQPLILGFGTESGVPLDIPGRGFIRDHLGKIVISKLNQNVLRNLAKETDGRFLLATLSNEDLNSLLDFARAPKNTAESSGTIRVYNEFGHIFVWMALAVLLISVLARRHAPIFTLLMLITNVASAQPNTYEAWQAYQKGDYETAKNGFESAQKDNPTNELNQALGSSYFKLKQYDEAINIFRELTQSATTANEKFEASYNLGNSYLQKKALELAINSYEEALKLKPEDTATKFNLEYAKNLLKEQKNKSEEPKPEPNKQEQPQNEQKEQSENTEETQTNEPAEKRPQDNQPQNQTNDEQQNSQLNEEKNEKDQTKNESSPNNEKGSEKAEDQGNSASSKETQQIKSERELSKKLNEKELAEKEAQRWLNSLPDAPVQIRRNQMRSNNRTSQTW
jgi:Ca-activated chloride channel family protein